MALCPPEAVAYSCAAAQGFLRLRLSRPAKESFYGNESYNYRPGLMGAIMPGGTNSGVVRRHGRGTRQPTFASALSLRNAADVPSGVFRTTE